jgi:hypothetical protein
MGNGRVEAAGRPLLCNWSEEESCGLVGWLAWAAFLKPVQWQVKEERGVQIGQLVANSGKDVLILDDPEDKAPVPSLTAFVWFVCAYPLIS